MAHIGGDDNGEAGKRSSPTSLRKDGIVHVGLKVSNADSSRRFYREILGLEGESREPGIVYVPSGRDMLIRYGPGKGATDFHFGFNVDAPATVDKWKVWLAQKRCVDSGGSHGGQVSKHQIPRPRRALG